MRPLAKLTPVSHGLEKKRVTTLERWSIIVGGVATVAIAVLLLVGWGLRDGWILDFPVWLGAMLTLAAPFAPYATALVAIIASWIAFSTLKHRRQADQETLAQREAADKKAEWWRRVQFAIRLVTVESDKIGRNTGMTLLTHLVKDPSSTADDAALLVDTVNTLIDEIVAAEVPDSHPGDSASARPPQARTTTQRISRSSQGRRTARSERFLRKLGLQRISRHGEDE